MTSQRSGLSPRSSSTATIFACLAWCAAGLAGNVVIISASKNHESEKPVAERNGIDTPGLISTDDLQEHLFNELANALLDDFGPPSALEYFREEESNKDYKGFSGIAAATMNVASALLRGSKQVSTVPVPRCCCADMHAHCSSINFAESPFPNVRYFEKTRCLALRDASYGDLEPSCRKIVRTQTIAGACLKEIQKGAGGVCSSVKPGNHRLHRCLHEHRMSLSSQCEQYMEDMFPSYLMLPNEQDFKSKNEIEEESGIVQNRSNLHHRGARQHNEVGMASHIVIGTNSPNDNDSEHSKQKRENSPNDNDSEHSKQKRKNSPNDNDSEHSKQKRKTNTRSLWIWIAIASILGICLIVVGRAVALRRKAPAQMMDECPKSTDEYCMRKDMYTSLLPANPTSTLSTPHT